MKNLEKKLVCNQGIIIHINNCDTLEKKRREENCWIIRHEGQSETIERPVGGSGRIFERT